MSGGVLFQNLKVGTLLEKVSASSVYADLSCTYELFTAEGAYGL